MTQFPTTNLFPNWSTHCEAGKLASIWVTVPTHMMCHSGQSSRSPATQRWPLSSINNNVNCQSRIYIDCQFKPILILYALISFCFPASQLHHSQLPISLAACLFQTAGKPLGPAYPSPLHSSHLLILYQTKLLLSTYLNFTQYILLRSYTSIFTQAGSESYMPS